MGSVCTFSLHMLYLSAPGTAPGAKEWLLQTHPLSSCRNVHKFSTLSCMEPAYNLCRCRCRWTTPRGSTAALALWNSRQLRTQLMPSTTCTTQVGDAGGHLAPGGRVA